MTTKSPEDELRQSRLNKLEKIRSTHTNPYPSGTKRSHTNQEVLEHFPQLVKDETKVTLVGRIRSWRSHGGSTFAHIEDGTAQIQVYFRKDVLTDGRYDELELLDIGDFIEAAGTLFETKMGEKTLLVKSYRLLSKSLRPLPNAWYGLKDIETRYRRRYLDFIVNPDVKKKILMRAQITNAIREFLVSKGFLEIENPILELNASGAMARPFTTRINAFDLDLFLRICIGELWQKRSLVGGFERVFEIGRAFRNEGVDFEHNPEFTMLEYYWAYASLEDNMQLHEKMFALIAERLFGSMQFESNGHTIDLTPPYPRKTFRKAILEHSDIDIEDYPDKQSISKLLKKMKIDFDPNRGYGNLLDELYKETTRPKLIQPTFITAYPAELKPLAKKLENDERYVDVFQLLINGMEISNSYNELNNPIDQLERFKQQSKIAKGGDDEAMQSDLAYVEALEYGMPPATGTGIGIDRLVALLTDSHHLREIIAYPLMKPIKVRQKGRRILQGKPTEWTYDNVREQDSLVLGKIVRIADHPDADTLKICEVDIGNKTLQILSNCSNLREDMLVVVALPGTTVFDWHATGKTQVIESSELRSQKSEAMMCASEEIGFHVPEDKREPLFEVPRTGKPLGTPIKDVLSTNASTQGSLGGISEPDPKIFQIDPETAKAFPHLKIGVAIIKGVKVQKTTAELDTYKKDVLKKMESYSKEDWKQSPVLNSYRETFKQFGVDPASKQPSSVALLKRFADKKGLYTINTVVDTYNLVSAQTQLCMAAYDLDTVKLPLMLRQAKDNETILRLGENEPTMIKADTLTYADQEKITCMNFNYRDSDLTKVTDETKNLMVFVDGCGEISTKQIAQALDQVCDKLIEFNGGKLTYESITLATSPKDSSLIRGARGVDPSLDPSLDPSQDPGITRDEALAWVQENIKEASTIKHVLAAEAAMRAYARKFGANEELWGIAGLLHDIAWEKNFEHHPEVGARMMRERGINELIAHAAEAHDPDVALCETMMDKILLASEELTGLITAYAHILPSKKLADVKAKSVMKKFKVKQFAANIRREDIMKGVEQAGLNLEEHIQVLIEALKSISAKLEL